MTRTLMFKTHPNFMHKKYCINLTSLIETVTKHTIDTANLFYVIH